MTLKELDQIDVDESHAEPIPMPHVQWLNGKGKAFAKLNPVIANGGFELPFDAFGNILTDTYEISEVPHGEDAELGYLLPALHIAVIARRFCWERNELGRLVRSQQYADGATGRYNFYCLVKELGEPVPVVLSLKGHVGKAFSKIVSDHLKTVIGKLRQVKGASYPQYTLWIPVSAGASVMVGKGEQSAITPPVATWDTDALNNPKKTEKMLGDLFIGTDWYNEAKRLKSEADEWSEAFKNEAKETPAAGVASDPMTQFWAYQRTHGIDQERAKQVLAECDLNAVIALGILQGENPAPPMTQAQMAVEVQSTEPVTAYAE